MVETQLTREQIDRRLAALGEYLELDALALDEEGMVVLELDEELEMVLLHLPGNPGLIVSAPIGNAELILSELLAH